MGKLEAGKWEVPLWKETALEDGERPLSRSLKDVGKGTMLIPREERPKHPGKSRPHNGFCWGLKSSPARPVCRRKGGPTVNIWGWLGCDASAALSLLLGPVRERGFC